MPVVRLEGVTKFFKYERKKRMAVQDIDLTIEQGEFVFLNGSRRRQNHCVAPAGR